MYEAQNQGSKNRWKHGLDCMTLCVNACILESLDDVIGKGRKTQRW